MTRARNLADLLDSSGDVKASALDNTSSDLVDDSTPELGGDLSTNNNDINFGDNDKAVFGAGNDLEIYHNGTENVIDANTGTLVLRSPAAGTIEFRDQGSQVLAQFNDNSDAKLYYNNSAKLATTSTGINVTGSTISTGDVKSQGSGSSYAMLTTNENGGELQLGTDDDGYRALVDINDTDDDGEGHFRLLNLSQSANVTEIGNAHASNTGQFKIKTANQDRLIINGDGSWGKAPAGTVLQVVSDTLTSTSSQSVNAGADFTVNGLSVSITPKSTSSKILLILSLNISNSSDVNRGAIFLQRGSTKLGAANVSNRRGVLFAGIQAATNAGGVGHIGGHYYDSPATTSATTYTVHGYNADADSTRTIYINRSSGDVNTYFYTRSYSSLIALEIAG